MIVMSLITLLIASGVFIFGYYLYFTNQSIYGWLVTYDTLRCEDDQYTGKLWVKLASVNNAVKLDDLSASDVYVEVWVKDDKSDIVTSFTGLDSATVEYNDILPICVESETAILHIAAYDKDVIGENDLVGKVEINITDLVTGDSGLGYTAEATYDLANPQLDLTEPGTITMSFAYFPSQSIDEVIAEAETGDIVLFSGDTASGAVIRLGTQSQWSHIGLVYVADDGKKYIIESSTNKAHLVDCSLNQTSTGSEFLSLYDKVRRVYDV